MYGGGVDGKSMVYRYLILIGIAFKFGLDGEYPFIYMIVIYVGARYSRAP